MTSANIKEIIYSNEKCKLERLEKLIWLIHLSSFKTKELGRSYLSSIYSFSEKQAIKRKIDFQELVTLRLQKYYARKVFEFASETYNKLCL